MFGAARRSATSACRRLDLGKTTGNLSRSRVLVSDSKGLLGHAGFSRLHAKRPLTVAGYQQLREIASSSFDRDWDCKDDDSHLRWNDKLLSVNATASNSFVLSSKVQRRGFASQSLDSRNLEWTGQQTSFSSLSAPANVWVNPLISSLGLPQGSPVHPNTSVRSRRHFSSETSRNSKYKTSAKIPTPKSAPATSSSPLASFDPQALLRSVVDMTWRFTKALTTFLIRLPGNTLYYLTHGKERRERIQAIKDLIRKEVDHYWTGSKLLMADVRTARALLGRTLSGSTLTRRERKQLLRTVSDLFRLVPFSMFVLIPMAEFALPLALRIFPNMMPSTFQDSLKAEEDMKRELQSRIAMTQFFQETLEELAKEHKKIAAKRNNESPDNEIANKQERTAESMLEFLDRARQGEMMPPDVIVQYAKYFQDDLTLDNMPRMQLVNMCRYMQLQPYGSDAFLRFQLRHKIRTLKEDDQRIIWEGIQSLTKMELREACQERGMRSTGLSKEAYKGRLQQWLDLSVHKNVPISLLIMSRTFFLHEEITTSVDGAEADTSVVGLADAISGMDKEVLNEVILEVATSEEKKSNPDIQKIKLEVVTQQNEMIREEREAAEKKKKSAEKAEEQEHVAAIEEEVQPQEDEKIGEVHEKVFATDDIQPDETVQDVEKSEETKHVEGTTVDETPGEGTAEEEHDHELSTAEMDAISQLLSADPVSKERQELARIKSAMQDQEEEHEALEASAETVPGHDAKEAEAELETPSEPTDETAAADIARMESEAEKEAEESTTFTMETQANPQEASEEVVVESDVEEEEEDPVVARLKKRVESMVDKIELQLSDVEVKIGDKLHILDKDLDGVLSQEEMAECLHQVLKREITFDEAMEIAHTMDENEDGVFTVQELIRWIETNKLVKLESEGRDADMDKIMENHVPETVSKEESG